MMNINPLLSIAFIWIVSVTTVLAADKNNDKPLPDTKLQAQGLAPTELPGAGNLM